MTTFVLVRHAESEDYLDTYAGRAVDARLTSEGEGQALALGNRLGAERIDLIQSSPRRRARRTAELMATRQSVEIHDAIDEIDIGEWGGLRFTQLADDPRWRAWNAARQLHVAPNGESMLDVQRRAIAHLTALRRRVPNGVVVLVTHAEVIRCVFLYYLGIGVAAHAMIQVAPAALFRLHVDERACEVIGMNERVRA